MRFKFEQENKTGRKFQGPGPGQYENKKFSTEGMNAVKTVFSNNKRATLGTVQKGRKETYVDREIKAAPN